MSHNSSVEKRANRLILEQSPYLLQHAYNPVDWYPWGPEAFKKARTEDKPIFLSIGYSTCHWCHVMEKESFEDPEVAKLLNETFISIKVDREERPDIDATYMKVCQMMTGSGGWPLNIIITPNQKPLFATTYIPKEGRFGKIGMKELIPRIKELWQSRRHELESSAERIISILKEQATSGIDRGEELGKSALDEAFVYLSSRFDELYGGFGKTPKFPSAHNLSFLLRYWKRRGYRKALNMVERTLRAMRLGGIYDHIGFGFHRYSTDSKWLVPHFEKMLYDQAMLTIAYLETYQATEKEEYAQTVREILAYVLRDMTALNGGFYSAEDADSEGEEGKFYIWIEDEIKRLLPKKEVELVTRIFNIETYGNFEDESTRRRTGKNILYMRDSLPAVASKLGIPLIKISKRLEDALQCLYTAREKRIHPNKDDKILTDWNGLMIAALAKAASVLSEEVYLTAAKKAANFIISNMTSPEGRLYHRYRDGEPAITGFLNDYSLFIWGLIELYEATFEASYLKNAITLTEVMMKHFWDNEKGGFYFTADDAENVLIREKLIYDGAYPSGNSIAALNMIRLSRMTANPEFEEKATQIFQAFSNIVSETPAGYTQLMVALDFALGPSFEVVIVGNSQSKDTEIMLKAIRDKFIPNKVLLLIPSEVQEPEITNLAEYTRHLTIQEGKATAYVCQDYECKLPTIDIEKAISLLNAKNKVA